MLFTKLKEKRGPKKKKKGEKEKSSGNFVLTCNLSLS